MSLSLAHRCRLRFALPFPFALLVLASGVSPVSSAAQNTPYPLLGVAPQDEKYFATEVIACRDGSKSFRRDRLNDGFCDCPDGTDEPGTPACPESRFYCRNIGDKPRLLFSSRVNDRICDCCDGSDEYDGRISCPNTCSKDADFFKESATNVSEGRISSQINAEESEKRVSATNVSEGRKSSQINAEESEKRESATNVSEGRKSSQINAEESEERVDSEDLISRLKELRIAVAVELFIAACVIVSCLFHWRARSRRRRNWYRN